MKRPTNHQYKDYLKGIKMIYEIPKNAKILSIKEDTIVANSQG